MSLYLVLPRKEHLGALFRIFAHLKKHHSLEMGFDPSEPEVDMGDFPPEDWSLSIYGKVSKELPKSK